jgi:tetratricopeptide (TPR) repeat protein
MADRATIATRAAVGAVLGAVGAWLMIGGYGSMLAVGAEVCERLGHDTVAKKLYRESAAKSKGKDAVDALIALAQVEESTGEREKALSDFQRARSMADAAGMDPLMVAALNSQVGRLRYNLGDANAVADLEKAVLLRDSKHGPNSVENYRDLYRIANIQQASDLYTEAIDSFERRMKIADAHNMGKDEVAGNLLEVGKCYSLAGNNQKAVDKTTEAVQLLKDHFGDNHPRVVTAMLQLATYKQLTGDQEFARHAVKVASSNQPTRDGGLLLVKIATAFGKTNNFNDAKNTCELGLKMAQQDNDPKLEALCLEDLAAISAVNGDYQTAKKISGQALRKYEEQYGTDANETKQARDSYRNVCQLAESHPVENNLVRVEDLHR